MVKFGQLVEEGRATFTVNPLTKAFGVIVFLDKMIDEYKGESYTLVLNNKDYTLNHNKYNANIKDVTLDTNKITEKQLKEAEFLIS